MSAGRPQVLIVGCGYVGKRLARRLQAEYRVAAIVRTQSSARSLEAEGIEAIALDLDKARFGAPIPERLDHQATFYLVPPQPYGESDLRLDRFLQLAAVPPRTFVYMSTTAVYGDTKGAWVDESTPVAPRSDRARRRVSAEEMTRVWCTERHVRRVVLRAPGIYGPGRLPLERLRAGEPVVDPEEAGFSNRIHVDDLVEACVLAMTNPDARGFYNVTDGNTCSATEFLDRLALHAGLPAPPRVSLDEAQLTFPAERLAFLNESRRVRNERMRKHLGVGLRYANLDEGIRQALSAT
jgi:nucleoside-diphosphate-sugar epimerase